MKKGDKLIVDGKEREILRVVKSLTSDMVIGAVVTSPVEVIDFKWDADRLEKKELTQ